MMNEIKYSPTYLLTYLLANKYAYIEFIFNVIHQLLFVTICFPCMNKIYTFMFLAISFCTLTHEMFKMFNAGTA